MAVNAVNTYFYRHHYLSIIQEEEENSVNEATPPSSRTNSRPSSIYGLNPAAIQKAYKEYKVYLILLRHHQFGLILSSLFDGYLNLMLICFSGSNSTKYITHKRTISTGQK